MKDCSTSANVQQHSPKAIPTPPPQKRKQADAAIGFSRAPKLSFAEAAARWAAKPPDLFVHNMNSIKPVRLNDDIAVIIPADMYELRLRSFQYALIGRLILPQGSAPRGGEELKRELTCVFGTAGDWILMPLGKGFFSLKFDVVEDKIKASRMTSWKLAVGLLQIREWQPNFNPYKELSSTAQVWVRLFHLPTEYWHPEFLVGIFRMVGNIIKLDGNTTYGLVGHSARALIEVDLTQPIIDTIRDDEDIVPKTAPFKEAGTQDRDLNKDDGNEAVDGECHMDYDTNGVELSTDEDKEFGELQYQSPATFMDLVTVSVDGPTTRPADISEDAKRRLIAKVKKAARNRKLRSELKVKSYPAPDRYAVTSQTPGTDRFDEPQQHAHTAEIHEDTAVISDSGTREAIDESQPSSTLSSPLSPDAAIAPPSPTLQTSEQAGDTVVAPTPAPVEDYTQKQQISETNQSKRRRNTKAAPQKR